MNIPANAFNRTSDNMGNFAFNCTFCYAATPLQVTSTVPAVGGTFTPPAPGNYSYDVNFNQNIDPSSVSTSDLTLTGNVGGSVTSVTVSGSTAHFMVHFNFGGSVTASIAAGSITAGGCNSNAAFTGNYTVGGCSPSWSAGPNLPTVLIRAVGVYFPADGNFYTMGGRTADTAGSDFQHVLRYSPVSNTWTQMGVTLPDNTMNNMACGVLTVSGTPYIYCVGGSAATQTTATARVFFYNPATDTATTLTAADNWPGDSAGTILPGGFAVSGNKMYILGGFNINVSSTNQIYSFDPTAGVGSKWVLAPVTTPVGIMYAPTTAIGGIIYVGGASDYSGGTVIDTTTSFSYNPATNTIGSIAPIPRATGETRALNFNCNMYVMGGGRVAPNPSTEVDIYNPGTNSWSIGTPFVTPRRNFPTDTNGTDHIWLGGGYATDGITPLNRMEIFQCASPLSITSAVSRKTHGAAGNFDIPLPLTGADGVECRTTGGTNDFTMVVTFSTSVTVTGSPQAQLTMGTGCVGSGGACTGNVSVSGSVVTVPLTNIANAQNITVQINGVNGSNNFSIPMGMLIGDTNANRTVNAADIAQTKSRLGQTVDGTNFRSDVNANAAINAADSALIKGHLGTSIP